MRIVLLFLLLLPACSQSDATGPRPETLQLNWVAEPEFGGFYAAAETGAFAKHGLSVTVNAGGAGTPVAAMVAAGQVRFGIASADEVVIARARGQDLVAIFATYQTCPQGLMAHASRGAEKLADLFAAPPAGSPKLTIAMEVGLPYGKHLERKYGYGNVRIVPYTGSIGPFLHDPNFAQQCFVTAEPLSARREGADPKTFLIAESGYNPYTAVVVVRGDLVRGEAATVRAMVAALREGWRAYLDDPKPANAVMAKLNSAMDASTFAAAAEAQKALIETEETRRQGLGAMTGERWGTLIGQLVELGVVEREMAPKAEECFQ